MIKIEKIIGIDFTSVSKVLKNFNIKEIQHSFKQGKSIKDLASFYNLDETLTCAIVLEGKTDEERFGLLGLKPKDDKL